MFVNKDIRKIRLSLDVFFLIFYDSWEVFDSYSDSGRVFFYKRENCRIKY